MLGTIQSLVNTVSSTTNSWLTHPSAWRVDKVSPSVIAAQTKSRFDYQQLPEYTLAEVAEHWMPTDCWVVVFDRVYDITDFLDDHPGGSHIIMEHAGRDATLVIRGSRHSSDAYALMDKYLIGELVEVSVTIALEYIR